MFGHDNDDKQQRTEQWRLAMQAELSRLSALPVEELATEVMIRGFGPGGPGAWAATRRGRAALERGAVEHIMRTRALNTV